MVTRWNGECGENVRRMGPLTWPQTPPAQLVGLTANSMGASERYCESFCALGYYQTPDRTWDRLRSSERVRSLLSRDAKPSAEFAQDIPGQVAIGLLDYRDSGAGLENQLPRAERPMPGTWWACWTACMAYVVGSGGALAVWRQCIPAGLEDDTARATALVRCATAADRKTAYPVVRAWQRLCTGRELARALGQSLTWWQGMPSSGLEAPLMATFNDNVPTPVQDQPSASQWVWTPRVTFALGVTLAAVAGLALDMARGKVG